MRSYTEIEEYVIEGWLKLSGQGLTFSEGQTAVWRNYLRRNPKRLKTLQRLAQSGKLNVMQAGEVVQDSNLPAAEGLIRNFLQAQPLYRELAGACHPALKIAWLEDAFGNSANYPQLLLDMGCEVVCSMAYRQPGFSAGMTYEEVATVLKEFGAVGGSATMVMADGKERAVGNNLAVIIDPKDTGIMEARLSQH